jgi:hypothetical protein
MIPQQGLLHISAPFQPPPSVIWIVYIFTAFAGLFGVLSIYVGINMLQLSIESTDWPSVQGTVTSTRIVQSTDGHAVIYAPEVRYTYLIGKSTFSSTQVSLADHAGSDFSEAQEILNHYTSGQIVTVYYRPSNPQESILKVGQDNGAYFALELGGMFLAAAFLIFFGVPRLYVFIRNAQTTAFE